MTFDDVPERLNFPDMEEEVLKYWDSIDAFKRSVELSQGRPLYTFYDGPPFATGTPHYGHLLAGTVKDIVTRYWHMKGYHVERRFGWDCHGLPVEYEIDKKLNIESRQQVLDMGIAKYNAECRAIVMRYANEWRHVVRRVARWIDTDNDYRTMDPWFMESVWWVFKQMFDKQLVYRSFKVMPYSTACTTPLSNFEANQNYKDTNDPSIVVTFPLVDPFEDTPAVLLAWTTTPWTLPSNLALCVHPTDTYVRIQDIAAGTVYVLMEKRLETLKNYPSDKHYRLLSTFPGQRLQGLRYVPLFEYALDFAPTPRSVTVRHTVLVDTYVQSDSGTGIVHQAPAFGEDDFRICLAHGVVSEDRVFCPVDEKGRFTSAVPDYEGVSFLEANPRITAALKSRGRLYSAGTIVHSYPFCWRSDTPLMYRTVPSWFLRVESFRDQLVDNNRRKTRWVPEAIQMGRFHNWLENARDWAISRNRYWGTPIPLWVSEDFEEIICVGSIEELSRLSGTPREQLTDLHRESIDHLTIPSQRPGRAHERLRRIEEVFDCWFESGSMPYAQHHYPFNEAVRARFSTEMFPAHFIAEGLDQTRGWFYTLMVVATALFGDQPAFQNLIVTGLVLAEDGKKMSKRLKNYPDPMKVVSQYGADSLRIYLMNSPAVKADVLRFKETDVMMTLREVMLPWMDAYRFLIQCCQGFEASTQTKFQFVFQETPSASTESASAPAEALPERRGTVNLMDQWMMACCQDLIQFVDGEMSAYRLYTVIPRVLLLIEQLTNWYVRFNRDRLKGKEGSDAQRASLLTLFDAMLTLCRCMAIFAPLFSEYVYQNLRKAIVFKEAGWEDTRSIHFLPFPRYRGAFMNAEMLRRVARMQVIIELGRVLRERHAISLKQPLKELVVVHHDKQHLEDLRTLESYIVRELNVKHIVLSADENEYGVVFSAEGEAKKLGPVFGKRWRAVSEEIRRWTHAECKAFRESGKRTVDGVEMTSADVKILTSLHSEKKQQQQYSWNALNDVLILLDITQEDEGLVNEGLARDLVSGYQKLRQTAGLKPSDQVTYMYSVVGEAASMSGRLSEIFVLVAQWLNQSVTEKRVKGSMEMADGMRGLTMADDATSPLASMTKDIDGVAIQLFLFK